MHVPPAGSRRSARPLVGLVILALTAAVTYALAAGSQAAPSRARAATQARPTTPAERQVPFTVGEQLTYDIGWSFYPTAGSATIRVVEKKAAFGSTVYQLVADGQPTPLLANLYPLYYKAESQLDAVTLLPHQGSLYSQEGRRRRTKTTRFDRRTGTVAFAVEGQPQQSTTLKIKPGTHDALSAFFSLRTVALKAGARYTIPVADDGETFDVRITVVGRESVDTSAGPRPAWRLTPEILDASGKPASDRRLAVWMSDDARRLPLKLEADLGLGAFVLSLRNPGR